ncbi:MAG: L-dopachrome tautomerase-related protein [Planctomycetota bacterium]|nr:L-dopachrome tautomerase-related protein [Planctomycetota bacterium]
MRMWRAAPLAFLLLFGLGGCGDDAAPTDASVPLELVAESKRQWTGVAVSPDERIFVNYPRWSDDVPISVAELIDGRPVPYPNEALNAWDAEKDPKTHFVCVQSVTVDSAGTLWILDPANPKFAGVVAGGPKLMQVDLATNEIVKTYRFDDTVALSGSYLNDVRVDVERGVAYITDSGDGALVVLDLESGKSRRLLDGHASTQAEPIDITIEGTAWKRGGQTPQVHADGIGLSPDRAWVYYQALTGRTMYRVPTAALRDASLSAEDLAAKVERVGRAGVSDGLVFDAAGNLYLSSLEKNAVRRFTPKHVREDVVTDPRLAWPDSFALGTDGWIYVTTALIHRGAEPRDPYRLWRFKPKP